MVYSVSVFVLLAWLLMVFFLATMSLLTLYRAGKMTLVQECIFIPIVAVGVILDVAFNVVSSVVWLELPHELTVTARVSRLRKGTGWRASLARWVCATLLDPFEQGGHCS